MTEQATPMRADARRNRDALLAAATAAFVQRGTTVALEDIARDAGVGVGTLYRNFPTRDALVEAVYRRELEQVAHSAPELLEGRTGHEALRAWTDRFLDYAAAKRGLGDALRCVIEAAPQLRSSVSADLTDAVRQFLERGAQDGTIRADVDATIVLRAMIGIFHIPVSDEWLAQARAILDLLLDGLRPR